MENLLWITVCCSLFISIWTLLSLKKEQKRNRILQSFISGIIRSLTDYFSRTDRLEDLPPNTHEFPIPYKSLIKNIQYEFQKDFWIIPHKEFLKKDRSLFCSKKYRNDGFNFMYWDFFDDLLTDWENSDTNTIETNKNS